MAKQDEPTNPVETPAEAPTGDLPGAKVEVTNPIENPEPVVYYSDQPGAGPNEAAPAVELTVDGEPAKEDTTTAKAVSAPPANKAVTSAPSTKAQSNK